MSGAISWMAVMAKTDSACSELRLDAVIISAWATPGLCQDGIAVMAGFCRGERECPAERTAIALRVVPESKWPQAVARIMLACEPAVVLG